MEERSLGEENSLDQEDFLEKEMATQPIFLPGRPHGQRSLVD